MCGETRHSAEFSRYALSGLQTLGEASTTLLRRHLPWPLAEAKVDRGSAQSFLIRKTYVVGRVKTLHYHRLFSFFGFFATKHHGSANLVSYQLNISLHNLLNAPMPLLCSFLCVLCTLT